MSTLYVLNYFCNLFGISILTSMQNLESVAQKMRLMSGKPRIGKNGSFKNGHSFRNQDLWFVYSGMNQSPLQHLLIHSGMNQSPE